MVDMMSKSETQRKDNQRRIKCNSELSAEGCWLWTRSKQSRGYGTAWDGGRVVLAHRLSYESFIGNIPHGKIVMHLCDTPACVNPAHLRIGTDRDNLLDSIRKGRRPKTGPTRGACTNAHLSPEEAARMKLLISGRSGSLRELALRTGVSLHIIKDISRGRTY